MIPDDTIHELAMANDYRSMVSDVRKCDEPDCQEPGMPCRTKAVTQYLCVEHSQLHGFCARCGEYVPDFLDLSGEILCTRCRDHSNDDDNDLISPLNVFGPQDV